MLNRIQQRIISALFGFVLGFAAGLVGVGGGEFRTPVLIYILRLPIKTAIAANLFIGLGTVIFSSLIRLTKGMFTRTGLFIAIWMSIFSILGGYIGAIITGKLRINRLKTILAIFLVVIGVKLLYGAFSYHTVATHSAFMPIWQQVVCVVLFGFVIGVISGMLGVAGGEFRIPVLMYIFGFDVKIAGTVSSLVSIPTVFTGFVKHRTMGNTSGMDKIVVLIMMVCSIIGSFFGVKTAAVVDKHIIEGVLGGILILATVRMFTRLPEQE